MGMRNSILAAIMAAAGVVIRYARTFNGTTDKILIPPAGFCTSTNLIPGTTGSGVRRSHPLPFTLANGDVLMTYTTNEFGARFSMAICKSTDGGATFGAVAEVGGSGVGAVDTYEAAFAQLSGGTVFFVYGEGDAVMYKLSSDNGATWGSAVTVAASSGGSDPHPSVTLDGSTLVVAYAQGTTTYVKRATVTSTTVGAFGSAITIAGSNARDPSLVTTSAGNLTIAYTFTPGTTVAIKRSTDSGATWGAATVITVGYDGFNTQDPNLILWGGAMLLVYTPGPTFTGSPPSLVPGKRYTVMHRSTDNGATWNERQMFFGDISYDQHRVNLCVNASGDLIGYATAIDGDSDYHINRLVIDQALAASLAGGSTLRTIDNLSTWTAWAWVYYAGTPNAAQSMQLISKGGVGAGNVDKVFLWLSDNGTTLINALQGFVNRSTTATQYYFNNAVADSTWTFVAVSYDDARGVGNRIRMWTGTTQANLTQRTPTVTTEGSGTPLDDSGRLLTVGGRYTDDLRGFPGDIGGLCGVSPGTLTLAQLQSLMAGAVPVGVTPAWASYMSSSVADASGVGAVAYLIGGSQAASGPPSV